MTPRNYLHYDAGQQKAEVEALALRSGMSLSDILRQAVGEYLEREVLVLKGYKVWVWTACYREGKFTHNNIQGKTVHAPSEEDARTMVEVPPNTLHESGALKTVYTSKSFIQSVDYLGVVKWKQVPYYTKKGLQNE